MSGAPSGPGREGVRKMLRPLPPRPGSIRFFCARIADMKRTRASFRLGDKRLDNVACSCLLACALADFAKKRARLLKETCALRFFAAGQDRFLLDELHRLHMPLLLRYDEARIVKASLAILRGRSLCLCGSARPYWDGLERLFRREYARGGVNLLEIDWE